MSQTKRRPCSFFRTPRGCRNGDTCPFSHDVGSNSSGPFSPPTSPNRNRDHQRPGSLTCRFWLINGRCNKGDQCTYRHQRDAEVSERGSSRTQLAPPLLGTDGVSNVDLTNHDLFRSLSDKPLSSSEIKAVLRGFLFDDFRFAKTFNIYAFWVPFQSAHRSNKHWSDEEGQLLLDTVASGNGILRINDIVLWHQVAYDAGTNPSILSFQRGYFPLLSLLSADFVLRSTRSNLVHALYLRILDNFDQFADHLESCIVDAMRACSFNPPSSRSDLDKLSGSQLFSALTTVFFEILTRFKNATSTYPRITPIVERLAEWIETWASGVSSNPPTFLDPQFLSSPEESRNFFISYLRDKVQRLITITDREKNKAERSARRREQQKPMYRSSNEGIVSALHILHEDQGPGILRPDGPRHDNDSDDIGDIRIAPTEQELFCKIAPYLPANFYEAPHHLPQDSMERLLDIQFRLLREELTAPLRTSTQLIRNDLLSKERKTQLATLIQKMGGKYKGFVSNEENVMFNVYTNAEFRGLAPDRRGISVQVSFDAPPGRARAPKAKDRAAFWEGMSGKRLIQGGLIALVWEEYGEIDIHLGILSTSIKEITDFVKANPDRVIARIVFFDASVQLRILQVLKGDRRHLTGKKLLVESPVMFEAIRPFLEALRVEPESLPFKPYLVHRPFGSFDPNRVNGISVLPPSYARRPGFQYQLAPLFPPESGITDLKLAANDPDSIAHVREALKESRLDPSQADAVVDTLTREVALIQGPPGTGKSFVGIELLRVLLQSAKPVLMIAFTNHALDHMLCGVLDAKITDKIVRLGGRSADERISEYSIENLEMVAGKSILDRSFGRHYRDVKETEKEIENFMKEYMRKDASSDDITRYLITQYPEHFTYLLSPPNWASLLHQQAVDDQEGWTRAGRRGQQQEEDASIYSFWCEGKDIGFLSHPLFPTPAPPPDPPAKVDNAPPRQSNRFEALPVEATPAEEDEDPLNDDEPIFTEFWESPDAWLGTTTPAGEKPQEDAQPADEPAAPEVGASATTLDRETLVEANLRTAVRSNVEQFFSEAWLGPVPDVPIGNRDVDELLADGSIWDMSFAERQKLHEYWNKDVITRRSVTHEEDFEGLRRKHEEAQKTYNEGRDEIKRQLLKNTDIVGCTTTGAAKLSSLLKGLSPRILLVEEAGQVLEAHILGSLVPSIEHLILIGDPKQLRPTLNNYALSMDSPRGSKLYRFDMSLMERLSSSGFPMSQINVQRRMRPEISNLIRKTLYPNLIDNDIVKSYPDVRGFTTNVYFLDHSHPENDGSAEDTSSKFNVYEVEMIRDLVLYLLRQGCYSQEGDIVVLCAYLGQLARVRDALQDQVAILIDERDQTELADREEDVNELRQETLVTHVKIASRVRLRTVDNYQGEEGRVVILSLVRNAGPNNQAGIEGGLRKTIGFLRSENRTNVALSRAKEGLYILGNKNQFSARSPMWKGVIDELEEKGCVGDAFPVACHRHPESVQYISKPGVLPSLSPDGGCLQACDARLKCGHVCPYKCHPDDPNHVGVQCSQRCSRMCPRQHPCLRECAQDCGLCRHIVPGVPLPCGHVADVYCHQMDTLDDVTCNVRVRKELVLCEHSAEMACSEDPGEFVCHERCNLAMACCGRNCNSNCSQCQHLNSRIGEAAIQRVQHQQHKCQKTLYCAHSCEEMCSGQHECTKVCRKECRQECTHSKCRQHCSSLCSPCKQPCTWRCPHAQCPVPCGSICVRLPCDEKCDKSLPCGHSCPSICGEDCSVQVCLTCASEHTKGQVVDLVMVRRLEEMDLDDPFDRVITLPKCKHVFTVETLDGVCGLKDWYSYDEAGQRWIGLNVPSTPLQVPVCPTCRAPVTSPRYGRAFKAADLDILERNVVTKMTQGLRGIQTDLDAIDSSAIGNAVAVAFKQATSITPKSMNQQTMRTLNRDRMAVFAKSPRMEPIHADYFKDDKLFPISPETSRIWKAHARPIFKLLIDISKVTRVRPAHVHAWESAFTYLYDKEIEAAVADPHHAPRNPQEHAMRMAKMKVGQPHPRSDKRFLVEAIWTAVLLRFALLKLVCQVLETISSRPEVFNQDECAMWGQYGSFVVRSCVRDSLLSFDIAEESNAHRQMTKSRVFMLRSSLEECRFRMAMAHCTGRFHEQREHLLLLAQEHLAAATNTVTETIRVYHTKLPEDSSSWLVENFADPTTLILEEWTSIVRSIRQETFYEPLSLDEKIKVVQAMNFGYTGHWYSCPNGHTFVITECGGAMEASRCPDCGERIGGGGHHLDPANRRADDFEQIAREQGAQVSPFEWGR